MATFIATAAQSSVLPKAVHVGVNAIVSTYTVTASLSAGDIIQICKVPDGATIINIAMQVVGTPGMADGKINIGTRADHNRYFDSATIQTAGLQNLKLMLADTLDVSDDATTRYTMIEGKVSDITSGTAAGSFRFVVQYVMDSPVAAI